MATTAPSEDARNFFQRRLALMHQVAFAVSSAFFVTELLLHELLHTGWLSAFGMAPHSIHLAVTVLLGATWWTLRRYPLRQRVLEVIDIAGLLLLSLLLNVMAALDEIRPFVPFSQAFSTGIVAVLRAVVVPSTARRTLGLGIGAGAMALVIFFLSGLHPAWPVVQRDPLHRPLASGLTTLVLWLGSMMAVATVASRVIYRLRREVRTARRLGQYVLGEKLGEGGLGAVFRARHALLRRETALKLLPPGQVDPGTIRRFEREVVETARLRHPNTVAIFDYGRTPEGVFYYAMEYLDGLTMAELVEREGPLPPSRVVHLVAQVCASLEEAHTKGIVHRDIKPANVMVNGETAAWDLVKVLDFGLVKSEAPLDGQGSLSQADRLTGTPLYMAPEAISRSDAADARSDLYAVGAVGYFMLTGQHVFPGRSVVEICAAHLHTPPVPPHERLGRDVPADLEALLLHALSKSPADRPSSAATFREALLRCDVPPWTEADARAWWRTHGERARRGERPAAELPATPTVSIVLEERLEERERRVGTRR